MFLSMMAADVAAQHGHEFSPQRASFSSSPGFNGRGTQRGSILPVSLLKQSNSPSRMRQASPGRRPALVKSVTFTESDVQTPTSVQLSRPSSIAGSDASSGQLKTKNRLPPRPKTVYSIAHPPPDIVPRQKLHLNPRVLLQLQKVSADARPKPALEVVPSMKFSPKTKVERKLGKFLSGKVGLGLGPEDVLVTKAEEYGNVSSPGGRVKSDRERLEEEGIVGVICSSRKRDDGSSSAAKIILDDCSCWEASILANGGYEFVNTDDHGLKSTVKWVSSSPNSRRRSQRLDGVPGDDKKFSFTTITPNSRRHPIIASLTRTSISILDSYVLPSSLSSPSTLTSPVATPLTPPSETYFPSANDLEPDNRILIPTDELLKKLIVVTGVWVAFRENWSPAFRYTSTPQSPAMPPSSSSTLNPPTSACAAAGKSFRRHSSTASPSFTSPRPRWRSSLGASDSPTLGGGSSSRKNSPHQSSRSPAAIARADIGMRRSASHSPAQSPRIHSAPAAHNRRLSFQRMVLAAPSASEPPPSNRDSELMMLENGQASTKNAPGNIPFEAVPTTSNDDGYLTKTHGSRDRRESTVETPHRRRFGKMKDLFQRLGRKGASADKEVRRGRPGAN